MVIEFSLQLLLHIFINYKTRDAKVIIHGEGKNLFAKHTPLLKPNYRKELMASKTNTLYLIIKWLKMVEVDKFIIAKTPIKDFQ